MAKRWYKPSVLALSDEEAAYLAGVFDGDGCLSKRVSGGSWQFSVAQLSSTGLAGHLYAMTGVGSTHVRPQTERASMSSWSVGTQADILCLLERIRPWLIVKSETADLALRNLRNKARERPLVDRQNRPNRGLTQKMGLCLDRAIGTTNTEERG